MFSLLAFQAVHSFSCQGDGGNNLVDMWMMIKAPRLYNNSNELWKTGQGYVYGDVMTGAFKPSYFNINTTESALGATFKQVYGSNVDNSGGIFFWNDEFPGLNRTSPEEFAHSKGALAWITKSDGTVEGFWITSSTPRFPPYLKAGAYSYPHSGADFGQNFVCVNVNSTVVGQVLEAFLTTRPRLYESVASPAAIAQFPVITQLQAGKFNPVPTLTTISTSSRAGNKISYTFKNRQWDSDIYEYGVAPALGSDILVESWTRQEGSDTMPSFCRPNYKFDVYNVWAIQFTDEIFWKRDYDHAKWAISTKKGVDAICFADINRDYSQEVRGGGSLCFQNLEGLQGSLYEAVKDTAPCGQH